MEHLRIPTETLVEQLTETLARRFPTTVFAVRYNDPGPGLLDFRCLDVIWTDGPSRDRVEEVLEPFQGREWDPATGRLGKALRYQVDHAGRLVQVRYDVSYIFCDGPYRPSSAV